MIFYALWLVYDTLAVHYIRLHLRQWFAQVLFPSTSRLQNLQSQEEGRKKQNVHASKPVEWTLDSNHPFAQLRAHKTNQTLCFLCQSNCFSLFSQWKLIVTQVMILHLRCQSRANLQLWMSSSSSGNDGIQKSRWYNSINSDFHIGFSMGPLQKYLLGVAATITRGTSEVRIGTNCARLMSPDLVILFLSTTYANEVQN